MPLNSAKSGAQLLLDKILAVLAPYNSLPSEILSGISVVLVGVWMIVPASSARMAAAPFAFANDLLPLRVWGIWLVLLGMFQWLAAFSNWRAGRQIGIWLIMMTRLTLTVLVGQRTNFQGDYVPDSIGWLVLAAVGYLKLREKHE